MIVRICGFCGADPVFLSEDEGYCPVCQSPERIKAAMEDFDNGRGKSLDEVLSDLGISSGELSKGVEK